MARRAFRWIVVHLPLITTVVTVVLIAAIAVAFMILLPLSGKVAAQATAGARARQTQCDREPVIRKVAAAAFAVRAHLPRENRITRRELRLFLEQSPKHCPKHR